MEIIQLFCIICFTALCSAEDPLENDATQATPLPSHTPSTTALSSTRPTVTLETPAGCVYTTATAHLQCHAGGGGHAPDLTYRWFHRDTGTPLASPTGPRHTIRPARLADAGQYWCQTKRGRDLSMLSSPVALCITELPVPTTEVQTGWSEVFPSETVEMSCSIGADPDRWTYTWSRGGQEVQRPAGGSDGSSLSISSARPEDEGQYTCTGQLNGTHVRSEPSNMLSLKVYADTLPVLTKSPSVEEIYAGERVSFGCQLDLSTGWAYQWYQNKTQLHTEGTTGSYVIPSASSSHSGTYWCTATRGSGNRPFTTRPSPAQRLSVSDIPKPSVRLITPWADVFPTENVELSCQLEGSSAWRYTWYRDGREMEVGEDGSTLTIAAATPGHAERYMCRGRHLSRSVTTYNSTALILNVYDEIPTAEIIQDGGHEKMYPQESLTFRCKVRRSSGWDFLWFRGEATLPSKGENYTIPSVAPGNAGAYRCRATRGHKTPFSTKMSKTLRIQVEEVPVPWAEVQTGWSEVFPSETVEMSCSIGADPDRWTYTWSRGGQEVQRPAGGSDGSSLSISSARPEDEGQYTCTGQLNGTPVRSEPSNMLSLKVYADTLPVLTKWPSVEEIYAGERVSFGCQLDLSTGWAYQWYQNKTQLHTEATTGSHVIPSASSSHSGTYWCTATRGSGNRPFTTQPSPAQRLSVSDIPKPSVRLITPWADVFPTEKVELSCQVEDSSAWRYTWYRDEREMEVGEDGSTLTIAAATPGHAGRYMCRGRHLSRSVTTYNSTALILNVYDEIPTAEIIQDGGHEKMYRQESLTFRCKVRRSSGWDFLWFHGEATLPSKGENYTIPSVAPGNAGAYRCRATRGHKIPFSTKMSKTLRIQVEEVPVPWAEVQTGWSEVFPSETVEMSCSIGADPDRWTYTWSRGGQEVQRPAGGSDGSSLSISSARPEDEGQYTCTGQLNGTPVRSEPSNTLSLKVYARPWATLSLLTGWSEALSTDRLDLKCEVKGGQGTTLWNYTWTRGDQKLLSDHEKHIVTPEEDPDQSSYVCQGVRASRPFYSTPSEPFETTNLLLKRRLLLSISGCLFFGIIAVFLGCIALRIKRKPVKSEDREEEPNLFFTMAELKASNVAPCPLADYVTDEALAALTKDGEAGDAGDTADESTRLPLHFPECEAETSESLHPEDHSELTTFKH